MKFLLIAGALAAASGVVLGAFGAHALKGALAPAMLSAWQTAVQYHLVHALGTLVIALAISVTSVHASFATWAGWMLLAGILVFSGSLYVLALTGVRWFGAITPFGGAAFIVGWLLFAWAAVRMPGA